MDQRGFVFFLPLTFENIDAARGGYELRFTPTISDGGGMRVVP